MFGTTTLGEKILPERQISIEQNSGSVPYRQDNAGKNENGWE
jgi:hypothetical protein